MPVISSLKSSSVAIKDVQLLIQNFSKPLSGFWWFGGHSGNLCLVFAGFASVPRSRGTGATGGTRDTEDTGTTGDATNTGAIGATRGTGGHRGHQGKERQRVNIEQRAHRVYTVHRSHRGHRGHEGPQGTRGATGATGHRWHRGTVDRMATWQTCFAASDVTPVYDVNSGVILSNQKSVFTQLAATLIMLQDRFKCGW